MIADGETEALIAELARRSGLSRDEAVKAALRQALQAQVPDTPEKTADLEAKVDDILRRLHDLPRVGPRLSDRDLYDETGLPR